MVCFPIVIIITTCNGAKCQVLHQTTISEEFEIQSGVPEGCILSPILLLLVMYDVLHPALLKGCRGIQ